MIDGLSLMQQVAHDEPMEYYLPSQAYGTWKYGIK
jgi:hypothetical protein